MIFEIKKHFLFFLPLQLFLFFPFVSVNLHVSGKGTFFLVHQAIFTSADKSYLTYPYPTPGMDKNKKTTRAANTLVV